MKSKKIKKIISDVSYSLNKSNINDSLGIAGINGAIAVREIVQQVLAETLPNLESLLDLGITEKEIINKNNHLIDNAKAAIIDLNEQKREALTAYKLLKNKTNDTIKRLDLAKHEMATLRFDINRITDTFSRLIRLEKMIDLFSMDIKKFDELEDFLTKAIELKTKFKNEFKL